MDNKLYNQLKHCWKMGYKLPKIKEYCDTDYSLEDLQEFFYEMWDNELSKPTCDICGEGKVSQLYCSDGTTYKLCDYGGSEYADNKDMYFNKMLYSMSKLAKEDIDDKIFNQIVEDLDNLSIEELTNKLKTVPNSGVGYAISGMHEADLLMGAKYKGL